MGNLTKKNNLAPAKMFAAICCTAPRIGGGGRGAKGLMGGLAKLPDPEVNELCCVWRGGGGGGAAHGARDAPV